MITYSEQSKGCITAELTDRSHRISETQDMLDLIADVSFNGHNRLIIYEENLVPDFFDLKSRLAGDILQKISNYRFRLAIVGDFSRYESKSLKDFIRECNRGKMVSFVSTREEALEKLI